MSDLRELLLKGDADRVIELTEKSLEPEDLVYRASALLSKGRAEEALSIYIKNRDAIYGLKPVAAMKATIELRCILKQYDEAYLDLEDFKGRPYVSQEAEEFLREAPRMIRASERAESRGRGYDEGRLARILKGEGDDYEALMALSSLSKDGASENVDFIKGILQSNRHPSVKTYALLLLVAIPLDEEVAFEKMGRRFVVNPKKLEPPYVGEGYRSVCRLLDEGAKDPGVAETAKSILDDYTMDIYPGKAIEAGKERLLAAALIKLARRYLGGDEDIGPLEGTWSLKDDEVAALEKGISSLLEGYPPLSM
jgi:tetratricopeptide (TPR) repeat protein